ncbi:hypothetical protein C4D60_Mb05t10630 [Musa balbisiana]|uniref:CDC20/Fizzy WD40 domain-containing protein n=1 Tax=Musa balbisiana TaxID=52838 RepID=A0A4S8JV65_MUSBA|nr:hypothetical protein C4D60_Mb05t10630 [Musa balbisiana]
MLGSASDDRCSTTASLSQGLKDRNTPSPSKTTYGDRFIPCRSSSRLQNFALAEKPSPAKEGGNDAYSRLLRAELFGHDPATYSPGAQGSPISPSKNLFRFKTDHSAPSSPFSVTSVAGHDTAVEVSTPPKVPRKIPKTPHKVLDAPSLQDDFYLNLVDWSSQNALAVGLGTCVYLWSATTSKVTKLCDLGNRDGVSAIQWSREGSYIAIGTSLGDVQVLDAPSLQDDFYLNLVDWSSQNALAVGLGTCVYLWSATTSKVTKLCDLGNRDGVSAIQWSREGSYIAIGTSLGDVQIWDGTRCKKIRSMGGHLTRTGVLAWNSCILSSGSRDKNILHHDLRVPGDFVSKLVGHRSEVCGLKWSHDDRELASGGNDNQLLIWNQRSQSPLLKLTEHTAAVKAITWSPHQHSLVASGGGTADRCIRFWNTCNGNMLNCVDTGSQVCNLAWSKNVNELVSTHGYSQNQIMVWKYPSLSKVATLTGHTLRVLYLAMSPDGQTIVTGAGDETLRFWNVFPSMKTPGHSCNSDTKPQRSTDPKIEVSSGFRHHRLQFDEQAVLLHPENTFFLR